MKKKALIIDGTSIEVGDRVVIKFGDSLSKAKILWIDKEEVIYTIGLVLNSRNSLEYFTSQFCYKLPTLRQRIAGIVGKFRQKALK